MFLITALLARTMIEAGARPHGPRGGRFARGGRSGGTVNVLELVRQPALHVEANITGMGVPLAAGPWPTAEDTHLQ